MRKKHSSAGGGDGGVEFALVEFKGDPPVAPADWELLERTKFIVCFTFLRLTLIDTSCRLAAEQRLTSNFDCNVSKHDDDN